MHPTINYSHVSFLMIITAVLTSPQRQRFQRFNATSNSCQFLLMKIDLRQKLADKQNNAKGPPASYNEVSVISKGITSAGQFKTNISGTHVSDYYIGSPFFSLSFLSFFFADFLNCLSFKMLIEKSHAKSKS